MPSALIWNARHRAAALGRRAYARVTQSGAGASPGRVLPPYPAALLLACALLCLYESAFTRGPLTFGYALYLACMLCAFALLAGGGVQLLLLAAQRLGRGAYVLWPALGLALGLCVSERLGAFTRLDGRHHRLAVRVLGACSAAGFSLGTVVALMQPCPAHALGVLGGRGRVVRTAAGALLAAAAAALTTADHMLYVGLYRDAHLALRLCAGLTLMLAFVLVAPELRLPRVGRRLATGALLLGLLPVAGLREQQVDTVAAFVERPWPGMLLHGARALLDIDRDGYAWALGGGDCNDFDPHVNPAAREITDNGVDDNCIFGDRKRRPAGVDAALAMPGTAAAMNVVLVTIDTLRWDRLGSNDPAYGPRGRNTMPELMRWAQNAVVFRHAYSPGGWTSIALGSAMRGLYARRLAFEAFYETTSYRLLRRPLASKLWPGEKPARMFPLAFDDPHPSLSQWLARRGMRTMAVVDDGFSQMLTRGVGTARGFRSYVEVHGGKHRPGTPRPKPTPDRHWSGRRDDAYTVARAIDALHGVPAGSRFFLWVHMFGPHAPSKLHPNVRLDGTSVADRYDHEVRYADAQLGRLLAVIAELQAPTAVFVTADHGEDLHATYRGHGSTLSEDVLRVPLVARVPGWRPHTVDALVSLIDLMPTVLALTATPAPPGLDGLDLGPIVDGRHPARRVLFSDTWQYGYRETAFTDLTCAFDGEHKLVRDRIDQSTIAYDQRDDTPTRVTPGTDRLARKLLGYLEESGGQLELSE